MVRMWQRRFWLTWLIIAASVDDLPEPVAPVTSTRPRSYSEIVRMTSGRPRPSMVGTLEGMIRRMSDMEPRWRNTLTRKRETPGSE